MKNQIINETLGFNKNTMVELNQLTNQEAKRLNSGGWIADFVEDFLCYATQNSDVVSTVTMYN